jgi:hypothetical protein
MTEAQRSHSAIGGDELLIGRMLRAVERLASANVDTADLATLNELLDSSRRLRSWVSSVEVKVTRRTNELHRAGSAGAPEGLLADRGGQSAADAKAAADRADVCDEMPMFESALAQGTIDNGHLDAIARATKGMSDAAKAELLNDEEALLASAAGSNVDRFTRNLRNKARDITAAHDRAAEADKLTRQRRNSRIRSWIDHDTGMGKTLLELDPVRHAELHAAIEAHLATVRQRDGHGDLPLDQLRLDAVIELVGTGGTLAERRIPEVSVVIDWRTLAEGVHGTTVCETRSGIPLPVQTVQRLCCEAEVLPVVLRHGAEVLHVGRAHRTATRAQRRALAAVHRTCAHPHCSVSFEHCQIHHIVPWERGGATDLDNLVPLCSRHHHLVHEGLWTIHLSDDRSMRWVQPNGETWFDGPSTDRVPRESEGFGVLVGSGPPPGRSR